MALMDFFTDGSMGNLFGGAGGYSGLLNDEQKKRMQQQSMMAMAAKLLQAGAPSRTRTNLGSAIGEALGAGQQAYSQAGQDALNQMLTKQKIDEYKRERGLDETWRSALLGAQAPQMAAQRQPGMPPLPGVMAQQPVQQDGIGGMLQNITPQQRMLIAGMGRKEGQQKLFDLASREDPEIIRTMRALGLETTPENYMKMKKAGATNVTQTMTGAADKSLGASVGTGIGQQLDTSRQQAQASLETLGNIDRMSQALDKAVVGPGADMRTGMLRIASVLGVAGRDDQERLANTRVLVQGLAQQELNSAQSMKGQGALSDAERALLKRAAIGDQTMSAEELGTAMQVARKVAQYKLSAHNTLLEKARALPGMQQYMPFYEVPAYTAPVVGGGGSNSLQFMIQQELDKRGGK